MGKRVFLHQVPLVWIHSSNSCAAAARKARTPGRSLVHMPTPSSLNRLRSSNGRAASERSCASRICVPRRTPIRRLNDAA